MMSKLRVSVCRANSTDRLLRVGSFSGIPHQSRLQLRFPEPGLEKWLLSRPLSGLAPVVRSTLESVEHWPPGLGTGSELPRHLSWAGSRTPEPHLRLAIMQSQEQLAPKHFRLRPAL